jgi:CubicO group peptidase (beta-lactamase class C family)
MEDALGLPLDDAVAMSNDPRYLTGVMPAANIVSTANEVSLFFECLLRGGALNGQRVISRRAMARAVMPQNSGLVPDGTIKIPIRYGLGFMLGGKVFSLFGPDTESAYGHLGLTNVLAWADPERDISVAFLNNGNPLIAPEMVAWMAVPRTIGQRFPRQRS